MEQKLDAVLKDEKSFVWHLTIGCTVRYEGEVFSNGLFEMVNRINL